jgi:WD40 repeat protein
VIVSKLYRLCYILISTTLYLSCLTVTSKTEISQETPEQNQSNIEEYSRWTKEAHSEKKEIRFDTGNLFPVISMSLSPDGKYMLSGNSDRTVQIWDMESGKEIRTMRGHTDYVNSVSFSPDGKLALSASADNSLKLWDALSGEEIRTLQGHSYWALSVAFSNNGDYIMSAGGEGTIKIWNSSTGRISKSLIGHTRDVNSVVFSDDGNYILSGSSDKSIKLWDFNNGNNLKTLEGHKADVYAVALSSDGQFAVSGSKDSTVKLWDLNTGSILQTFNGHTEAVVSVNFTSDDKYILSGSDDNTLRLWEITTGKQLYSIDSKGVETFAITENDDFIISGDFRLWNLKNGKFVRQIVKESHIPSISSFSADGKSIYYGTEDKSFIARNIESGISTSTSSTKAINEISSNGRFAVSGIGSQTIDIVDPESLETIFLFSDHSDIVSASQFSPDNRNILTATDDGWIILHDLNTGKIISKWKAHSSKITSAVFSQDGKFILSGSTDSTVKQWDSRSGRLLKVMTGHTESVSSVAISKDNRFVVSASEDETIKLWNLNSGSLISTLQGHSSAIDSVDISKNGKYAVSGSRDKNLMIWDLSQGKKIKTLSSHNSWVNSVCFSPDQNYILSSSLDGTQKLWNFETGELIYTIAQNSQADSVMWTNEGYFAGNRQMAKEIVYLVDGFKIYKMDQLFEDYYRPDIIQAKVIGIDVVLEDSILNQKILSTPQLKMTLVDEEGSIISKDDYSDIKEISNNTVNINIEIKDTGGGIGELRLFHNSVRILGQARGLAANKNQSITNNTFPIRLVNGQNIFTASVFSSQGIESEEIDIILNYRAPEEPIPSLWIMAVGINEYKNSSYDLNYAVSDANSIITAIEDTAADLFPEIHTYLIINDNADKEEITSTFTSIKEESKEDDVFIFFFAGHGIAMEYPETDRTEFFFIPYDVTQMTDINKLSESAIAGPEFVNLVGSIPARKQFFILDACNSGALNSAFGVRGAAEEIALAHLNRSAGSTLIAASRDDQVALEFAKLGQGALTKAMLDGLSGDAALASGEITVQSLKSYVEIAVPKLTEEFSGRVQYPKGFVFGQDFIIGIKK